MRGAWVRHTGWSAIIIMPDTAWDEIVPGAVSNLASLKLKKD